MLNVVKSRFAGKQKILYIAVITIASIIFLLLFNFLKTKTSNIEPSTTHQEQTTYTVGKSQQFYKHGKDSAITSTKTFHNAVTLNPSAVDSTYNFTSGDSSYKLSLNIHASADSSFSLEYFLNINSKDLVRIDTIFLTRIDTLKIKDTITIKQDPPFYNTFLFGALTTALVIILLIHFIP